MVLGVFQEQVPSVDVHVHVAPQVLRELADAEVRAAARDGRGEIQPPLHERVLGAADDGRRRPPGRRGGGAREKSDGAGDAK